MAKWLLIKIYIHVYNMNAYWWWLAKQIDICLTIISVVGIRDRYVVSIVGLLKKEFFACIIDENY